MKVRTKCFTELGVAIFKARIQTLPTDSDENEIKGSRDICDALLPCPVKGNLAFGARLVRVVQNVYHGVHHFTNDWCRFDVHVVVDNEAKIDYVDADPQLI